jgi:hypothetical protein
MSEKKEKLRKHSIAGKARIVAVQYKGTTLDNQITSSKRSTKLNHTGSAWKTGFDIFGLFFPHWLLTVVALFLFVFAIFNLFDYFSINPSIPQILSFYGLIHVIASALGFFSQGSIRLGLILTGTGYLIFVVSFLRWK